MNLPSPRGPVSDAVLAALRSGTTVPDVDVPASTGVLEDDDLQVVLWTSYQLHYAGFDEVDVGHHEWDPGLIGLRAKIEKQLEACLRESAVQRISAAREVADEVPEQLFAMAKDSGGPSLAAYLHREAERAQFDEFLVHRSLSQLKESDPAAWVLPRLRTAPKAVLAELLYDEFGGGRPEHVHSVLYADAMRAAGLDDRLGGYVDRLPASTLALDNVVSFLGLHHRLRGAALGHLAAFEATSSLPSRKLAAGAERLDYPPEVAAYFDEHVEADSVHEQLAVRGICGGLVAEEPALADDVLLGAAACLELEERWGARMLEAFEAGRSSLREEGSR